MIDSDSMDSDHVEMNIPVTHPLFGWIRDNCPFGTGPVRYIDLSVGNVKGRLALKAVTGMYIGTRGEFLKTEWTLLEE